MKSRPITLNKSGRTTPMQPNPANPKIKLNLNFLQVKKKPRESVMNPKLGMTPSGIQNSLNPRSPTGSKGNSKRNSIQLQKQPITRQDSLQSSIAQILDEKKRKMIEKKIEEKNRNKELERLLKERDALRTALCNIIDHKTSEIISQKMFSLSQKITKILRLNEGTIETTEKDEIDSEMKEEDSFWKKRNESDSGVSKDEINDEVLSKMSEMDFNRTYFRKANTYFKSKTNQPNSIKEYFVKNNKINQIFRELELIEQSKKIDKKKKYDTLKAVPNFYFLRKTDDNIYQRSAKAENTLTMKSFRPKGFRSEKIEVIVPEKNKKKDSPTKDMLSRKISSRLSKSASVRKDTYRNQDNLFITKTLSNSNTQKRRIVRSATSLKNTFGLYLQNPNVRSDIIRRFRKLMMDLIEENTKNHEYFSKVFTKRMNKDKNFVKNMEIEINNLEKLYQKNKKNRNADNPEDSDSDEENRKFLKKIDKRARGYFVNYFKNIAFHHRVINNHNDDEQTFYEKKISQMKQQKEFKSIAYQTMYMEGIKKNEDVEYMKKELVKDVYSVENIEWQVKKHNVLKKLRDKK